MTAVRIRIIAVPPGEAPEAIREAWVGVVIPLSDWPYNKRKKFFGIGVISGPKSFFGRVLGVLRGQYFMRDGYAVDAIVAVDALSEKSPEAAIWWRINAIHLMKSGKKFLFPAEVCEEVQ